MQWVLANGKSPTALPTSEKPLLNVEGLNDARMLLADFFSVLLIARWFEVARWTVLPRDRRLFGLFDEAT